jgi:two-component system sensor histidine kinase RegB
VSVADVSRAVAAAPRRRRPRQRTLVLLRWTAAAGQTAVLLGVHFGLGFETPLLWCLVTIGLSAWLNVALSLTRSMQDELSDAEVLLQVGFDTLQATVLIALTGGMNNPFALLLIGPVAVGTAALSLGPALLIGLFGVVCATLLKYVHLPLPWETSAGLDLPYVYEVGMWAATIVGMAFTAGYAWLASREASRMELALAAAQHVLAREQRLSALGALAAAAAHELGTPLATIQITAKEMSRVAPDTDGLKEDAQLLVSQAERCRDILKRLSHDPEHGDPMADCAGLEALLEEVAEPHRGHGPEVVTTTRSPDGSAPPVMPRSPEIVHALTALVENAVDFAREHVIVLAVHDRRTVTIEVADDGRASRPTCWTSWASPM